MWARAATQREQRGGEILTDGVGTLPIDLPVGFSVSGVGVETGDRRYGGGAVVFGG